MQRLPRFPPLGGSGLCYGRAPWRLRLRKEVFSPSEPLVNPTARELIFQQLVRDTLGGRKHARFTDEEVSDMRMFLQQHGVVKDGKDTRATLMVDIINRAKKCAVYFARHFPVTVSSDDKQYVLAVGQAGIALANRYRVRVEATGTEVSKLRIVARQNYSEVDTGS